MEITTTKIELGGKTLELEVGRFAEQANAAVVARYGDTVVLVTAVMSSRETDLGYFPLQVEFAEKLYAGGKIKGSRWVKREGRPTDEAILTARLIDRSIRPLFPDGLKREVQVIVTPLSVDGENDPDIPALIAASAALHISDIPWEGPIAAVRVGLVNGDTEPKFITNPTHPQQEFSTLDLIVSGSKEAIVMVEAGANEISEATAIKAIGFAHDEIKNIVAGIEELRQKVGKDKATFTVSETPAEIVSQIKKLVEPDLKAAIGKSGTKDPITPDMVAAVAEKFVDTLTSRQVDAIIFDIYKKLIRENTLTKGVRPDGRKLDEIRQITVETGLLPRTHGSAMFKRGMTQALTITTLGSPDMGQLIESMEGEETKRYIHHYFMPPYTVGETGRVGWPSRREIGHGALAERALEPVIPPESEFPYTIRVVSEIMSSNGSTSMASTCGSTLSLMDAGVPIKKPVSGIAMGLVSDGEKMVVLSDIAGIEDHTGDMDFKVAGTKDGITALQMDIKLKGLPAEILEKALEQARVGRLFIMDKMLAALPEPRKTLSKYAPKIEQLEIPTDKIGEIIGPGGKMIRAIIAETGAQVDIDDSTGKGIVTISGIDQDAIDRAVARIQGMVKVPEPGEIYEGTVKRIMNFGAFVEILPGKEGLVHVSRMSKEYVKDPNDIVKVGDAVTVKVTEIDNMGRLNLTMVME